MANINPGAPKQQFDWQNPNQATFDFGRVLGRSFTGVFANLKPLAIAVVISLIVTVSLNVIASEQLLKTFGDGSTEDITAAVSGADYWIWTLVASGPAFLFALWVQLVVVQTSHAKFTKSPLQSAPLIAGLRLLLPMFVIAVIYSVVSIIGFYALVIGFVFVWPGWALAGPILVHEKKGIFGSIGEAWNLSRGSKRWILLLLFLLMLISGVIYFIMVVISAVITNVNMFSSDPTAALDISTGQQIINGLIVGIPGYFVYALFAAGLTAAYVEIKTMNGGVETVGDVFS